MSKCLQMRMRQCQKRLAELEEIQDKKKKDQLENKKLKEHRYSAKDIFKAEIDDDPKIPYLNLKIKNTKITKDKKFGPWGVYFIFFKTYLIYIGSWCGNWDSKKRRLSGSAARARWSKHIITDTTRFQDVTFTSNCEFDKDEIIKLLKNPKETVKLNKKGKATLATAIDLYKNDKVNENKYKDFINKEFDKIKQKIKLKYCSHNSDSTICEDVIAKLDDIKYDDLKSHQAILAGGGKNHSLNRFKFSGEFWNKFKKRDEKNIFEDFEFVYFKFYEFEKSIPELETLILEESNRKIIKELFREFFELPFIKKYQPAANDDKDKKKNLKHIPKFTLGKHEIEDHIKEVKEELIEMCKPVKFLERFCEEKSNKKKNHRGKNSL